MIFDGKNTSKNILDSLKEKVASLPFVPEFSDVLVGTDGPSVRYVNKKKKVAEDLGIKFIESNFDENVSEEEVIKRIQELSLRPNMCGIIVQLPLPAHMSTESILNAVPVSLDVDALSEAYNSEFYNTQDFSGMLVLPTVLAISEILKVATEDIVNKKIAIVGQGRLVGKPLAHFLRTKTNLIETIDKNTENTIRQNILQNADIVISAVGKPGLITKSDIKDGAIVIDAGTMEMENTLVGDVNLDVSEKASFMTPTPGGVGPMTVAALMQNIVTVAENKVKNNNYA